MKNVLLTGATGLLGTHLLRMMVSNKDLCIFLLIRDSVKQGARDRGRNLVSEIIKRTGDHNAASRIHIISGDIIKDGLGLGADDAHFLSANIHEIFHCAALTEFRKPLEEVRLFNVGGTKNIMDFSSRCSCLQKLHYISTAFIAGTFKGMFSECDLDVGQGFNNTYEQSKFEAELLVREYYNSRFHIAIYRPSIVVGEYATGETNNFNMFYQIFRSLSLGIFDEIPLNYQTKINIIPCDFAAKAIFSLSLKVSGNETYHIVALENLSILKLMQFMSIHIGYKEPKYIDSKKFNFTDIGDFEKRIFEIYGSYLNFQAVFNSSKTYQKLAEIGLPCLSIDDEFLKRIVSYGIETKFILKGGGNHGE